MLFIDDSQELLAMFRRLLEGEGYRVTTSPTLLSRERILALAPDVLVLELITPDGVELGWDYLTLLHRDPGVDDLPVVLCTTAIWYVQQPLMAAHLERLGVRVVPKPCQVMTLLTAVAETLRFQDLEDEEQVS